MRETFFLALTCLILSISSVLSSLEQKTSYEKSSLPSLNMEKGKVVKYRFSSQILKNRRDIWVYTPPKYSKEGSSYPVVLIFDGQAYISSLIPVPQMLDRLIAQNLIPDTVAIFVSSINQPARNLELPCYQPFADFLARELLPWARKSYNITSDPLKTIVAGSSYGGLAAAYVAFKYPDLFGNVLSQSGAFWWRPSEAAREQWIIKQFTDAPKLSLRFYLDAGNQETEARGQYSSILSVNQKMYDTLNSKGYTVYYTEFDGGHEYKYWAKAFPRAITALLNAEPHNYTTK